jgi:hypothetical protein
LSSSSPAAGVSGGIGILVSTKVKATAAVFTVRDPGEVGAGLAALVEYGRSGANGWRRRGGGSCHGWAPARDGDGGGDGDVQRP